MTLEDAIATKRPSVFKTNDSKLNVLQNMVQHTKILALWTTDVDAHAFFNNNHLRTMPNIPKGQYIARRLVEMKRHVDTLTVPISREDSLKDAKGAVNEYKSLIEIFQAITDEANQTKAPKQRGGAGTLVSSDAEMAKITKELVPNPDDLPTSLSCLAKPCPYCKGLHDLQPASTAEPLCSEERLNEANKMREAAFEEKLKTNEKSRRIPRNGTGPISMPYRCLSEKFHCLMAPDGGNCPACQKHKGPMIIEGEFGLACGCPICNSTCSKTFTDSEQQAILIKRATDFELQQQQSSSSSQQQQQPFSVNSAVASASRAAIARRATISAAAPSSNSNGSPDVEYIGSSSHQEDMGRQIKDQPWTGHDQFVAMKEVGPPTRIVTIGGTRVNVSELAGDTRFNNNNLGGDPFFADLAGTDMQVTIPTCQKCGLPTGDNHNCADALREQQELERAFAFAAQQQSNNLNNQPALPMIHTSFSAISSSEAAVPPPRPQPSPQSSADTTAIDNIETIKKRLGDAIERHYSPDMDKIKARKKKLRFAMMVAKENSDEALVQAVLSAAVRKDDAAELAEDVAVIHNKYNKQERMDPDEDILSQG